MANNFKISDAARSALADALVDSVDAGAGPGTMEVWEGTYPTGPGTSITDGVGGYNRLAVLTFSDPAFGSASTGVATASAITSDTSADKSGTAQFFRVKDSNGTVIFQGTCGTSGADMNFDNATIVAGGTVACSSFTVTVPTGGT